MAEFNSLIEPPTAILDEDPAVAPFARVRWAAMTRCLALAALP